MRNLFENCINLSKRNLFENCINLSKMHFGVGKLVQLCYNDSNSVHSIYGNTAQ